MQLGEDIWAAPVDATAHAQPAPDVAAPNDLQEILKAARASQSRERSFKRALEESPHDGSVTERRAESVADVDTWLAALPHRKNEKGRALLNAEQLEAVHVVATRVKEQIPDPSAGEPLRWLLHGGPGTGKSHVIKQVQKFFEEVLGWKPGVEFQAAALQAVTADLIEGDTLHHACGIPVFSKTKNRDAAEQSHMNNAKRALQWRWLIIDEISMVSAKLLATIDMKLRSTVRELGTTKLAGDNTSRPFGGLNVLLVGDFWQLEPPDGGFLGSIPVDYILQARKFQPAPTISHGQALLWSGRKTGVQGVTELHQCERQDDAWLIEVQDEIRAGALSEDNYNFMHNLPTTVPGSWLLRDVLCGRAACKKLAKPQPAQQSASKAKPKAAPKKGQPASSTTHKHPRHATAQDRAVALSRDAIHQQECEVCKRDRASKALVSTGPLDPRWTEERFSSAPAIFPNNDTKYHVNKLRAALFATRKKRVITYAVARDKPSAATLKTRPDIGGWKQEWLQRHDRECGDLYGMLPLILDAPYALTDHQDRNPEKRLLRGKVGYLHSWILDTRETCDVKNGVRVLEHSPVVIFLKFPNAKWTLAPLKEPGLYPIRPKSATWFLDKGRQHPVLAVQRRQLPISPAFAITTHAAQGQTLLAAIVDLQILRGSSPIGAYVASTRTQKREDMLIYKPFDYDLFTQGPLLGPSLLLRMLRGEKIDWKEIEKSFTPSRPCNGCSLMCYKQEFHLSQFNRKDERHFCRVCVERKAKEGTPYECRKCFFWKAAEAFDERNLARHYYRICQDCVERRQCRSCMEDKQQEEFTCGEWEQAARLHSRQGRCRTCMTRNQQKKKCLRCGKAKKEPEFSPSAWKHPAKLVCKVCAAAPEEKTCLKCGEAKKQPEFSPYAWKHPAGRVCKVCAAAPEDKPCIKCGEEQGSAAFSDKAWRTPSRRICNTCVRNFRGLWKCNKCQDLKPKAEFSSWLEGRGAKVWNASAWCNPCREGSLAEQRQIAAESSAAVMRMKP